MRKLPVIGLSLLLLGGCSFGQLQGENKAGQKEQAAPSTKPAKKNVQPQKANPAQANEENKPADTQPDTKTASADNEATANSVKKAASPVQKTGTSKQEDDSIQVIAKPEAIPVLVNKQNKLPDNYNPSDLVTTSIPFIKTATSEKRKMRQEAAAAIAEMFAGAKQDNIQLLGVSAYRSHATQTTLFNYYVSVDGYEKARTYSALPGTSEHETGLAIDVTEGNGKCAADDCFGGTPEAKWLQDHVAEYGFIIRYPKGKESITGYKYEPWHLRYVGKKIAAEIMDRGITLEEYYHAVLVQR